MKKVLWLLIVAIVLMSLMFGTVAMAAESENCSLSSENESVVINLVEAQNAAADREAAEVFANTTDPPAQMSGTTQILIIIAIVIAVFVGLAFIIPYLVKKGVNISGVLTTTNTALGVADMAVDGLKEFFPNVPAFAFIDKIIGWAMKGAEAAEQLYKTSKIAAEDRNEAATKLVYEFIAAAGVELDENMKKVVKGSIEAAVYVLPKTNKVQKSK